MTKTARGKVAVVGCRKPFELARALWVCSAGRRDVERGIGAALGAFGGRYSGRQKECRKGKSQGTATTLNVGEGVEMEVPGS